MAIDINVPSQIKNYANLAGFPITGTLKTIFIAEDTNKTYRWTGSSYVEISASQAASWGTITGTLSTQTDLQTALNAKVTGNTAITGATKTKVTFDSKGLVTSGADATTADIADSLNKRYVTDANLTTIANQSGVNTGDQTLSGLGGVPTTRTLTINGTTQDLSVDRTFTVATGITIGTTAITSGVVGRVLFEGTGNVVQESANLFWDNVNGRLGIGQIVPTARIHIQGSTALTSSSSLVVFNSALTELFRIRDNGNIGINTTTDAGYKLDVNGSARVNGVLSFANSVGFQGIIGYSAIYGLVFQGNIGSNSDVLLADRNGNLRFRIVNGGNIIQTATVINNIGVGVANGTFGSITAGSTYGVGLTGQVASLFHINMTENTGNFGIWVDSSGRVKIGAYNSTYNSSAILEAVSTTQGFLPPRMTTTQKNAIATPASGLMVYDTTLNVITYYNGTTWI